MALSEKFVERMFKPGQSGNPAGKPKGVASGRAQALGVLDSLLAEEGNIRLLRTALRARFRKNPYGFFREIVMPLLPKETIGRMESGEGVVQWRGLLSVCGADVLVEPKTVEGETRTED